MSKQLTAVLKTSADPTKTQQDQKAATEAHAKAVAKEEHLSKESLRANLFLHVWELAILCPQLKVFLDLDRVFDKRYTVIDLVNKGG